MRQHNYIVTQIQKVRVWKKSMPRRTKTILKHLHWILMKLCKCKNVRNIYKDMDIDQVIDIHAHAYMYIYIYIHGYMIYDTMGTIVYYILFKSVVVCILEIPSKSPGRVGRIHQFQFASFQVSTRATLKRAKPSWSWSQRDLKGQVVNMFIWCIWMQGMKATGRVQQP